MRESYVRPVTAATEPVPEWRAVWRFRAVSLVLLALVGVAALKGFDQLLHAAEQDPTSGEQTEAPQAPGGTDEGYDTPEPSPEPEPSPTGTPELPES